MRHGLPVVIHTGFQIWGHASLWQSNPMHLHNLLTDPSFRHLTFVLPHGGNPYTAETAYLAGMLPNVVIDFTWIAWMSRTRFRAALADWLECVPFDRFVWGSDSGSPEGVVSVDAVVRREIAGVLEGMTREGLMDERASLEFLEKCYWVNAKRIFDLGALCKQLLARKKLTYPGECSSFCCIPLSVACRFVGTGGRDAG